MILNEEKNYFTNSNLYIIRLINRIYYLMSLLDEKEALKLNGELEKIHEEFRNAQDAFSALANGLEKNAPFKGFQAFALKGYEQDLETFLESLTKKSNKINIKNNMLGIIFSKINFYSLMLEKRNIKIEDFKDLTDYIRKLIYNFNDEALDLFSAEINTLFIETLRFIKKENLEMLVDNTNSYFYLSLINYAEKYLFEVIYENKEEITKLKNLKNGLSEKEYLIVLFQKSITLHMLSHETLIHKSK